MASGLWLAHDDDMNNGVGFDLFFLCSSISLLSQSLTISCLGVCRKPFVSGVKGVVRLVV